MAFLMAKVLKPTLFRANGKMGSAQ